MKIVELIRLSSMKQSGTFGVLLIDKHPFCVTLEPPDNENATGISNIPTGQYLCNRYSSEKYPSTFQVMRVYSRTKVLFHSGNRVKDTEACILLAQYFGKLEGDRAVLNSGSTFKKFMEIMQGIDEFHLTVSEKY